jgi:hypothetical protein
MQAPADFPYGQLSFLPWVEEALIFRIACEPLARSEFFPSARNWMGSATDWGEPYGVGSAAAPLASPSLLPRCSQENADPLQAESNYRQSLYVYLCAGLPFQRTEDYRFSVDNFSVNSMTKGVTASSVTPFFFNGLRRKRLPFQRPSEGGESWRCANASLIRQPVSCRTVQNVRIGRSALVAAAIKARRSSAVR